MPVRFQCPTCGATVKAPESQAGKSAICPRCRGSLRVPKAPIADLVEPDDLTEPTEQFDEPELRRHVRRDQPSTLATAIKWGFGFYIGVALAVITVPIALMLLCCGGCGLLTPVLAPRVKQQDTAKVQPTERPTIKSTTNSTPSPFQPKKGRSQLPSSGRKTERNRQFDEKDMVTPINAFSDYTIGDYRELPNCLSVFNECVRVPFDGKTEDQYKSAVSRVAQGPCRMMLKLVDVSAQYDYAEFELLNDDGKSALPILEQAGDVGSYTKYLKNHFAIRDIKAKGLDSKNRSIGDRVVLVGLGYIVSASPWGASVPLYGMPKGDQPHITLRAFGKLNKTNGHYEFAFIIRNWYIASQ
jgi:hypothetical protein